MLFQLIHSVTLSWETTVMEIKGLLLNIAINKLHARAAVAIVHQVDVTEYISMQMIYIRQSPILLLSHL